MSQLDRFANLATSRKKSDEQQPADAETKGAAGFWIARIPIRSVLEGDPMKKNVSHAEDLLKDVNKLDVAQQKRLSKHLVFPISP